MEINCHRSRSRDRDRRCRQEPDSSEDRGSRQRSWHEMKSSRSRRSYADHGHARLEEDHKHASRRSVEPMGRQSHAGRNVHGRSLSGERSSSKERGGKSSHDRLPSRGDFPRDRGYRHDYTTSRYEPRSDERYRPSSNPSHRDRGRDSSHRQYPSPRGNKVSVHVQSNEYNERTEASWDEDFFETNGPEPTVGDLRQRIFQRVSQTKSPSNLHHCDRAIDSETSFILFAVENTAIANSTINSCSSSTHGNSTSNSECYKRLFAAQTLREAGIVQSNDTSAPPPPCRVVWAKKGGTMPPIAGSKKHQRNTVATLESAHNTLGLGAISSSMSRNGPSLSSQPYQHPTKAELDCLEAHFGGCSSAHDPCMDSCMEGDLDALGVDGPERARSSSRSAKAAGWSRGGPVWGELS